MVQRIRRQQPGAAGAAAAWAAHLGFALLFAAAAFACVLVVPQARGSGLPQLLAYLNGCKLHKFTSFPVLLAKAVGTVFALSGGFYCGPEGPIIHLGGCIGKLLVRGLYHLGQWLAPSDDRTGGLGAALSALKNDLDQRDFVAIGAGAGVAAAFMAPVSATLFVVEEAASHFSLSLLWRAFTAATVALWASHGFIALYELAPWRQGAEPGGAAAAHRFHIKFEVGTGDACDLSDLMLGY